VPVNDGDENDVPENRKLWFIY